MSRLNYIDLFAGAGGLSEGFIRSGFNPIAHIEMDSAACLTLKTRIAYHHLKEKGKLHHYTSYLKGEIDREELYSNVPDRKLNTVFNTEISDQTLPSIFKNIDRILKGKKVHVIIGGPPCQAYSLAGRGRDPNGMKGDKRNYLFTYYGEFLKRYRPKFFVFENVKGLLYSDGYFEQMLNLFQSDEVGYHVEFKLLDTRTFGVLQARERVIIIGKGGKKSFSYPEFKDKENGWKISEDLFADLPKLNQGEGDQWMPYARASTSYLDKFEIRNGIDFVTQHIARPHNPRDLKIYKKVLDIWLREKRRLHYYELPENLKTHSNQHVFTDRFKVVDPDGPSHTLVAHISKDGHYYIHPDPAQNRSISVREAARIQSFPDDYFFEGGRTPAFKQIGNAVPPLMAGEIAKVLKSMF
jgi:DNA (cytosine-5)-methyltransferase 1